jgi:hyperosmotically inducible protein
MISKLLAVLLTICLVASAVLAADKPVSDDTLFDQVRIRLAGDAEVKGGALKVDVKEGVVTLGGTVETQRQKDKATKLAKKVKGVKQVVNNIVLKDK